MSLEQVLELVDIILEGRVRLATHLEIFMVELEVLQDIAHRQIILLGHIVLVMNGNFGVMYL